ncbi:hypothetical protein M3Y97_00918700 [Aphelenchoides bicaudatus]|nr:hypothetical protein M3Y97_00918700 [Aphelenchoides bicaudatus]
MFQMRVLVRQIGLLLLLLNLAVYALTGNYYSEKLYLKPRESNSLLAQLNFNFIEHLTDDGVVKFSPVLQSLLAQCKVRTLEFSIAQGFWRNHMFGLPPELGGAPGVHLVAHFDASVENVEEHWKTLVRQLNGLFCSSFEVVGETSSARLQMPNGPSNSNKEIVWYGAFTGDSICTENVESLKRLLPCHRTGLCQLLNNVEMQYESLFYSVAFLATLQQNKWTANVQANILKPIETKTVSVHQLFRQHFSTQCPMANESVVVIEQKPRVVVDLKSSEHNAVQVQLNASQADIEPLPVEFSSFVRENHLFRGKFISSVKSLAYAPVSATFTHLVPWQINIWYSSIQFECQSGESKYELKLRPRVLRKSPTLIEMSFDIPPQTTCQISYEFQKSFLHFTEYPPDASNGIHAPGPILTLIPSIESQLRGSKIKIFGEPSIVLLPTSRLLNAIQRYLFCLYYCCIDFPAFLDFHYTIRIGNRQARQRRSTQTNRSESESYFSSKTENRLNSAIIKPNRIITIFNNRQRNTNSKTTCSE